jgi:putative ABC transport system ATP-binding protein
MNSAIDPEMLRRFFCFADLTSEEARQVAGLLSTIDLENGEMLFQQGEPSTALYLLISGEVQIRIDRSDGSRYNLVMLGPGAIIGEMGPLTDEPRGATCIARTDTHLAELPYRALDAGLAHGDRWASRFLRATAKVLAQRLAALNRETLSMVAELEKSKSSVRTEDELERLRRRLLTEWTF